VFGADPVVFDDLQATIIRLRFYRHSCAVTSLQRSAGFKFSPLTLMTQVKSEVFCDGNLTIKPSAGLRPGKLAGAAEQGDGLILFAGSSPEILASDLTMSCPSAGQPSAMA